MSWRNNIFHSNGVGTDALKTLTSVRVQALTVEARLEDANGRLMADAVAMTLVLTRPCEFELMGDALFVVDRNSCGPRLAVRRDGVLLATWGIGTRVMGINDTLTVKGSDLVFRVA